MRTAFAGLLAFLFFAGSACAAEPDLTEAAEAFLSAYARGDKAAVEAVLEPDVRLYGSDVAEFYEGTKGFEHMFANDMRLWAGSAKFGAPGDVSTTREGNLATIFFNVPFSVGARPALPVRVAMVWRLDGGQWKLVQSSNAVPTVGQSGDELLKPQGH